MNTGDIQSLLSDSPELQSALEAVREIDREQETWTFDDIPVDSGAFGELVDEGVVESVREGYRLTNPEAVARALGDDIDSEIEDPDKIEVQLPDIDRTASALLTVVLAVTAAVRSVTYPAVFRDRVVFTGNDPYFYVYLVEEGLRNGWSLSNLPLGQTSQEPLTTVQLLYSAELAGGLGSHGPILALSPVIVAVLTVLAVYLWVYELTKDRRIALGASFALAVMPIHALRSSLGFVDHHAFDYFWLVLVAWGLTITLRLNKIRFNQESICGISLLSIGIGGLVLAWWAGALLIVPIGIAILVGGMVAVREDDPFLVPGAATCAGVGIGTVLILLAHRGFGWHDRLIISVPVILFIGSVAVVLATNLWRRFGWPPWTFPIMGLAVGGTTTFAVYRFAPERWARIQQGLGRLAGVGFEDTLEFQSIFGTTTMGWLFLFGFLLLFAIPYMVWGMYTVAQGNRQYLGVTAYAWFILVLAISLSRFGGELSMFLAVFAGVGFVHVAAWIEAAESPTLFGGTSKEITIPDRGATLRAVLIVGLICSLSIVMAPISVNTLGFSDEQYGATVFMDQHATEHRYDYPESYVFSPWSWNRMYNYYVNGEARSYGPARTHYREFSAARDERAAMERVNAVPGTGKYVVTEPVELEVPSESMQYRLHDRLGSHSGDIDGLAHFRALYVSASGDYKVFRVVPGATVQGSVSPDETLQVSTEVDIEGASFIYQRRIDATANGNFSVTVPYSGEYELKGADGNVTQITVEESTVLDGNTVRIDP